MDDAKLPLSRFAAALFSASLRERWIASDELSGNDDDHDGSDCRGDGMQIVTPNGWPTVMVDGGPRKHKVPPRTGCSCRDPRSMGAL